MNVRVSTNCTAEARDLVLTEIPEPSILHPKLTGKFIKGLYQEGLMEGRGRSQTVPAFWTLQYNRPNEGITPCNGLSNRPSRLSLERLGIWQRFPVPVPASWESCSVKIFSGATTWRDSSSPQAPVHYLWSGADY
ncbi:hypothetical protein J6590_022795 [Homalodisca vitripennis]|nr:hypothetical protein J6590_022795 [Homalodisca vitripennis]